MEYLHIHGVVHRDIKSGNILVNSKGKIKIADFGSSKQFSNKFLDSVIGTACYIAPEVIKNQKYERYADIWSLGCTVYEMINGHTPFRGNSSFQVYQLIN